MEQKYSVLLIGCGNMGALNDIEGSGNEHKTISYAKALKENEAFEVFLYDKDREKMLRTSDIWKFSWVDEYDTNSYDVIIIATPDDSHYWQLKNIIKYEDKLPKLVICEKPLCSTYEQAREIVGLYEQAGVPILVDYTRRFIPELRTMDINPVWGVCSFNRGWLHTATHAIDFFNMFGIPEDKQKFHEVTGTKDRVWAVTLFVKELNMKPNLTIETNCRPIFHEQRLGDEPVHEYYDYHTRYVINNAYNFLQGNQALKCTMHDALKALEIMERLMKNDRT
jgi:hypothetical protein